MAPNTILPYRAVSVFVPYTRNNFRKFEKLIYLFYYKYGNDGIVWHFVQLNIFFAQISLTHINRERLSVTQEQKCLKEKFFFLVIIFKHQKLKKSRTFREFDLNWTGCFPFWKHFKLIAFNIIIPFVALCYYISRNKMKICVPLLSCFYFVSRFFFLLLLLLVFYQTVNLVFRLMLMCFFFEGGMSSKYILFCS